MSRFRLLLLAVVSALVGCSVTFPANGIFECESEPDCGSGGWVCVAWIPESPEEGHYCCHVEPEVCDGKDNDCDGAVDDNLVPVSCYTGPQETLGKGSCRAGIQRCEAGALTACEGEALPVAESCNGGDDDCDGVVDNGFNLQTDVRHCGGCNQGCDLDIGQRCVAGVCKDPPENCQDGVDNDRDGVTDCADTDCNDLSCGSGCRCAGGVRTEGSCWDGQDNDQDGVADCADGADCGGRTCHAAPATFTCEQGACLCGGTADPLPETSATCTDGADNDCDGATDCADPGCANVSCGSGCECRSGAKTELACQDGLDNDGDGQADCADSQCGGSSCGAGCLCQNARKTETDCGDGSDNDGDGRGDCADPDCMGKTCEPGKVCQLLGSGVARCR